jgi:hypothetical protein
MTCNDELHTRTGTTDRSQMIPFGWKTDLQDHLQELLVRHLHPAVSVGIRALESFGERLDDHAAGIKKESVNIASQQGQM